MADTPPRTVESTKSKGAPKRTTTTGRKKALKTRLQSSFGQFGVAVSIFNRFDGQVILEGSEGLAEALDHWANESPTVKRTLEAFLTTSTVAEVLVALGGMAIPIAANHNLLPAQVAELAGAPSPDRVPRPSPGQDGAPASIHDFPGKPNANDAS